MVDNIKVSVIMSVYNCEEFLGEAVSSILGQTFRDFEFIIVDDGSTDRSLEVLRSFDDDRIRIIENESNIGLTRSLNIGLSGARGEYIARMDADDISLSERLSRQVSFLDAHPEVGLAGCTTRSIDRDGKIVRQLGHPESDYDIKRFLYINNRFVHSSVMIRRSVLDKYGGYNERLKMAQDYELFLRLSPHTKFANLSEPLHLWRLNDITGISIVDIEEQGRWADEIRDGFLKDHLSLDKWYVDTLSQNFKNDPKDKIVAHYMAQLFKRLAASPKHMLIAIRTGYYLLRYRFK